MLTDAELMLLGKAALAAALGFVIGWERERAGSAAGDRTFALVTLGSAVLTALAMDILPTAADRVVAGTVTGIGFLGAGMILRQGTGEIRGLTTAACLWAMNGVGVVVGSGHYLLGILLSAIVSIILVWDRLPVVSRLGSTKSNEVEGDTK